MKGNFKSIINEDRPVIVDFFAEWCGPCKTQSPILQQIAAEYGEKIRVLKIDVDKNPDVARSYQIQGVPTVMIFKKGVIVHRQAGVHTKQQLVTLLTNQL